MGGGPGGFRTMTEEEMQEMFGTDNPFSDFFNTFFGGGGRGAGRASRADRTRSRARKGRDLEHELPLTLEEADQGVTRRFSIKHDGHARTVDVRVPAGVGDGSRVRVGGEGEPGAGGAAAGDLYLRVRLEPHPQFERKGRDLYTRIAVPLTTAVLGGEVNVPALGGTDAAAEGAADDAERAGVPAARPGHESERQAGRAKRSLRHGRRRAAAAADARGTHALRGAGEDRTEQAQRGVTRESGASSQ